MQNSKKNKVLVDCGGEFREIIDSTLSQLIAKKYKLETLIREAELSIAAIDRNLMEEAQKHQTENKDTVLFWANGIACEEEIRNKITNKKNVH